MTDSIGIIGYGRFGKTLANVLKDDFKIFVHDIQHVSTDSNVQLTNLTEIAKLNTIFLAVPIREFESVIKSIAPLLTKQHTLLDTCSVKIYPADIMQKYCGENVDLIATHPLFGPDSVHNNPLKIVMHALRDQHQQLAKWQHYFTEKNWQVLNMTPDEHDRLAANTQAITHFVGRCLGNINLVSTPIDTLGYQKLLQVMEQTCRDSVELFEDMNHFNPYAKNRLNDLVNNAKKLLATT